MASSCPMLCPTRCVICAVVCDLADISRLLLCRMKCKELLYILYSSLGLATRALPNITVFSSSTSIVIPVRFYNGRDRWLRWLAQKYLIVSPHQFLLLCRNSLFVQEFPHSLRNFSLHLFLGGVNDANIRCV